MIEISGYSRTSKDSFCMNCNIQPNLDGRGIQSPATVRIEASDGQASNYRVGHMLSNKILNITIKTNDQCLMSSWHNIEFFELEYSYIDILYD